MLAQNAIPGIPAERLSMRGHFLVRDDNFKTAPDGRLVFHQVITKDGKWVVSNGDIMLDPNKELIPAQ